MSARNLKDGFRIRTELVGKIPSYLYCVSTVFRTHKYLMFYKDSDNVFEFMENFEAIKTLIIFRSVSKCFF